MTHSSDVLRHFLIGTTLNVLRIPALGVAIGYLYNKLNGQVRK